MVGRQQSGTRCGDVEAIAGRCSSLIISSWLLRASRSRKGAKTPKSGKKPVLLENERTLMKNDPGI